jgi:hypothetical protein
VMLEHSRGDAPSRRARTPSASEPAISSISNKPKKKARRLFDTGPLYQLTLWLIKEFDQVS